MCIKQNKVKKRISVLYVIIVMILSSINACSIEINADTSQLNVIPSNASLPITERKFLIGMNPHIKQFNNPSLTEEQFGDYLDEAFNLGKNCIEFYPRWPAIKWTEATTTNYAQQIQLYQSLGWISIIYMDIAEYYLDGLTWKIKPLLDTGMSDTLTYNDTEFINAVKNKVNSFIQSAGPTFIMFGNEINQIYELNGLQAYKEYTSGIAKIAEEIHKTCPNVYLGTTVSYTQLMVDISNNTPWAQNRLFLLDYIDTSKLDYIGINSYPFKEGYANPSSIPINHYKRLEDYLGNFPIIFSEIAWPSGADYSSSETEQNDFLIRFLDITMNQNMNVWGVLWFTMHDFYQPTSQTGGGDYQKSWGLRDVNSNPKLIWDTWMALKALNGTGTMRNLYASKILGETASSPFTMAHLSLIIILAGIGVVIVLIIKKKRKGRKAVPD